MDNNNPSPIEALNTHPIFSLPKSFSGPLASKEKNWLELSTSTLPNFKHTNPRIQDGPAPSGRRQTMVLRDSDLIVAAGKDIRITHLGDTKISRSTEKQYKTLHVPNIQFDVHQISLNPSGKLLAVAGAFQVAVIVLPRSGFSRLVPDTLDCKAVQVGQYHHASTSSPPIAKIDWHPWGDAGTTLLVLTIDGKLREYDISIDAEDPQQMLAFVPERKSGRSFIDEDPDEREASSFTLGKGRGDWGPLTIYAVMKSGDIYSICPYMPRNASVPSAYVHSLECFISAKRELLAQGNTSSASKNLSVIYDYQQKYVSALVKQLPPGSLFPTSSRTVKLHPPSTIKASPMRQGPFLLQPSPRALEDSDGGEATDITYLAFGDDPIDEEGAETEHLGVVIIVYQDGKVDLCLDVEKVEARWDTGKSSSRELPMLAVYETVDLGLVSQLLSTVHQPSSTRPQILDLLQANYPVFVVDPIHDDTLYIYHAFGVHALPLEPMLQGLALALKDDDSAALSSALQRGTTTTVQPILSTFSVEKQCSNPVIAVTIPDNVYLTYSIFILTSAMRITTFSLALRSDSPRLRSESLPPDTEPPDLAKDRRNWFKPADDGPGSYISLLTEPFKIPDAISRPSGLPSTPRLSLPQSAKVEFTLTPESLRYFTTVVTQLVQHVREAYLAHQEVDTRAKLQYNEMQRMCATTGDLYARVEKLKGPRRDQVAKRVQTAQETQKELMARLNRMLQHMIDKASPELSEDEMKWFEELKRMKQEVVGGGAYDGDSLVNRAILLQREYDRILPDLKVLLEKEKAWKAKNAQKDGLGVSQAFEIGQRSSIERSRIQDLQNSVEKLAAKLDMTLSTPPRPYGQDE